MNEHCVEIRDHLQIILDKAEDLQRRYDKMLEDVIIVGAELGVKEMNYEAVIKRVKELRKTEEKYNKLVSEPTLAAELSARDQMLGRMTSAWTTPLTAEEIALREEEEVECLRIMPDLTNTRFDT